MDADQLLSLQWDPSFDSVIAMNDFSLDQMEHTNSMGYNDTAENENIGPKEDLDIQRRSTAQNRDDVQISDDPSEPVDIFQLARAEEEAESTQAFEFTLPFPQASVLTPAQPTNTNHAHCPSQGKTALHLAAERGQIAIVDVLLQRDLDPSLPDSDGRTALHVAVEKNHPDLVQMLARVKANVNAQDDQGHTALHLAVIAENVEMVEILLGVTSIELESKDKEGQTALHHASVAGSSQVVNALLAAGADIHMRVG
jgi:hypothetical protein